MGDAVLATNKLYVKTEHGTFCYNLNEGFQMKVNGVEVPAADLSVSINTFIAANNTPTVKLVDTDKDGAYDNIEVAYYLDAVISDTNGVGKIYFDDYQYIDEDSQLGNRKINLLATLNPSLGYTVHDASGNPLSTSDIQPGDVISVFWDVVNCPSTVNNSPFVDIIVSRDRLRGTVSSSDANDGYYTYTIDGVNYESVLDMVGNIDEGIECEFLFDAFGYLTSAVDVEKIMHSGIINTLSKDGDIGRISIITKDGEFVEYTITDQRIYDRAEMYYLSRDEKSALEWRSVKYLANHNNEITSISREDTIGGIYYADTHSFGIHRASGNEIVYDLREADNVAELTPEDIKKADFSLFQDGKTYKIIRCIGNYYTGEDALFVLSEEETVESTDNMAMITAVNETSVEAVVRNRLIVETLQFEAGVDFSSLKPGDFIEYHTEGDNNTITSFSTVYQANSEYQRDLFTSYAIPKAEDTDDNDTTWYDFFYTHTLPGINPPEEWKQSPISDRVQIVFGPVVDRTSNSISLAKVVYDETAEEGKQYYTTDNNVFNISYDFDANIYVCDFSNDIDNRLFRGTAGTVMKTYVPSNAKDQYGTIYWNSAYEYGYYIEDINYAFVKMLDGEATDVYFINGLY